MQYTKETLRNYSAMMKSKVDEFRGKVNESHVSFSSGNMKIGRVLNVSIASGLTCGNCGHCLPFCYDIKAALRFPEVKIARAKNTAIAEMDRDRYFSEIDAKMSRRKKNLYFRFHQGGEIMDYDYLERMIEIAKRHPEYKCIWTYTKMHSLVNMYVKKHGGSIEKAIPENMVIMFSEWDGLKMYNPYGFPVFTVRLKDGNKNHEKEWFETLWKCPGNCDICKEEKRGCMAGESTFADEH